MSTTHGQLESYIEAKGIDLNADYFYTLASDYRIDPGFALATWILETGWGKSNAWLNSNNPAGITCSTGYCTYSSKEEGLAAMFDLLQSYTEGSISYIGKRTTPESIREAWSEAEDTSKIVELWRAIYD